MALDKAEAEERAAKLLEPLPEGWLAALSRQTSQIFFVNTLTGRSQQHRPDAPANTLSGQPIEPGTLPPVINNTLPHSSNKGSRSSPDQKLEPGKTADRKAEKALAASGKACTNPAEADACEVEVSSLKMLNRRRPNELVPPPPICSLVIDGNTSTLLDDLSSDDDSDRE